MTTVDLFAHIKEIAQKGQRRQLTGKNILVKNLFHFLYEKNTGLSLPLLFCTKDGLVLHAENTGFDDALFGCTIARTELKIYEQELLFHEISPQYLLLSARQPDASAAAGRLGEELSSLLRIIQADESRSGYLLQCLDSVKNAISIYDGEARLLYANSNFCRDLSIEEPDSAIGRNINDVVKELGIKIHSMEDNSTHLKMMDVLKKGEEAIDWEVRIEYPDAPDHYKMVSNDMYPVLDSSGQVKGMVELTHSRQQDIKRTRKIMGFAAEYTFEDIIGTSKAIKEKVRLAKEYANSPFNFLITGESGVGKELFAQSIHNYSPRRKGPFVALNCANFSDGLIESELFGYVGGAFTGASKNGQVGKFELADGGTLFLDEIGELPLHFQAKLLRVLETWMVTRIGSSRQIPVNVRLLAATNRDLMQMVEEGLFREDLYYRLQVLTVEIPPLRERREDLLPLAKLFLAQAAEVYGDTPKLLDEKAKGILTAYDWPGNVRELKNVINRATVLSKSGIISGEVLENAIHAKGFMLKTASIDSPEDRIEKRMQNINASYTALLKEALAVSGGNKKKAAELIGVSRKTFYRMLEKYGAD